MPGCINETRWSKFAFFLSLIVFAAGNFCSIFEGQMGQASQTIKNIFDYWTDDWLSGKMYCKFVFEWNETKKKPYIFKHDRANKT